LDSLVLPLRYRRPLEGQGTTGGEWVEAHPAPVACALVTGTWPVPGRLYRDIQAGATELPRPAARPLHALSLASCWRSLAA
jgi:hypothetical protein